MVALLGQEVLQRGEKTLGAQFHSSLLTPLRNSSCFAPKPLGFVVTCLLKSRMWVWRGMWYSKTSTQVCPRTLVFLFQKQLQLP